MRARIANSGVDFWAMLAAAALATLLLVAATQLQAQTYSVPPVVSGPNGATPALGAITPGNGSLCAAPAPPDTGSTCYGSYEAEGDGLLMEVIPD